MSRQLPDLIDPIQIADKGQELTGQVAISRMLRITDSLTSSDGCLDVALRFGKDESGQRYIKGRIQGELQLCCQRCMTPMAWALDTGLCLALVRSEAQIETLPDIYEPFIVPEEKVKLVELLEDEVILQLPHVPRHELSDCPAATNHFEFGDLEASDSVTTTAPEKDDQESRVNPFSVLANLKKKDSAKNGDD